MTKNKVHVIEADLKTGHVRERDALGVKIAALAFMVNEPVWFHDYKEPAAGAPVILLECSDSFLEEVKKLPGFAKTFPVSIWKNIETERSETIRSYFMSKISGASVSDKTPKPKPPGM